MGGARAWGVLLGVVTGYSKLQNGPFNIFVAAPSALRCDWNCKLSSK